MKITEAQLRKLIREQVAWDRVAAGNKGPDTGKQMANFADFCAGWDVNENGLDIDSCENRAERRGWEAFEVYGDEFDVEEAFEQSGFEYGF